MIPRHRSWVLYAMLVLTAGCATYGTIYVGQPQVFTRERLLGERLEETGWLKTQLARSDSMKPSVQGLRDVREFAGVATDLRAAFDPTKGALSAAQSANDQLAERTQFWRLSQAELEARRGFEQAQTSDAAPTAAPGERTPGSASAPTLPTAPTPITATLPDATPRKSAAEESEVDKLTDQIAFRNIVNATIKDVQLDDTHDQFGSALYEMLFDLTVVPGDKSHEFAKVTMNIDLPTKDERENGTDRKRSLPTPLQSNRCPDLATGRPAQLSRLYDRWIEGLGKMLNEDVKNLWNRALHGQLSTGEAQLLEQYAPAAVPPADKKTFAPKRRVTPAAVPEVQELRRNLAQEYSSALKDFATISDNGVKIEVHTIPEPDEGCTCDAPGVCKFVRYLQAYEMHRMNAFRVDPREHAQNISEVRAREMVASATVAVQAALAPQGANADASAQAIRRSQEMVDAISRKPLVVGFSQGRNEFGWILGPRFTIPAEQWWLPSLFGVKSAAEYLHTPARYTFAAAVIAPAWLTQLCVRGSYAWIDGDGDEHRGAKLFVHAMDEGSANCGDGTTVFLPTPPDITRSITRALVNFSGRETSTPLLALRAAPKITYPAGPNCSEATTEVESITVTASSGAQTLLIRGEEVWRSPEVYIGAQRADEVSLLPDMNGLYAKFTQVAFPPGKDSHRPALVDLRVVTSFGEDCVKDAVRIILPSPTPATNKKVTK